MSNSILHIELIKNIIKGDLKAFKEVYELYFNRSFQVALTLVKDEGWAEDIVQEVFFKVWDNRAKLNSELDIWYYIYVLTKNCSITKLREINKETKLKEQLYVSVQSQFSLQDDIKSEQLITKVFDSAKNQLTPQQRVVFELCREEGMTHQQIAEKLQISKNTVKNHMISSLKILRHFLKKDIIYIIFYFFI